MPTHVVVTGAGGFVGGFLARYLSKQGFQVTAASRRPAGVTTQGIDWLQANLGKGNILPVKFDALVHCAAEIPARCPDPEKLYHGNFDISRSVFDQAVAAGTRTILFLSSMSVYGTVNVPLVTEDLQPCDPDPYGRAKLDSEQVLESCVAHGLHSAIAIRLPGTVGNGSHHNFLSNVIACVLNGSVVEARNPAAAFNNIVYVGDLASFVESWIRAPRPGFVATNLGATEPMAIRDVLSLVFRSAARLERVRFLEGGKRPFLIDLTRAISIGYRPATVRASVEAFVRDCMAGAA